VATPVKGILGGQVNTFCEGQSQMPLQTTF